MQKNYQPSLEMILHHEGGYVNHPRDPGGETNLGVTKRVYEEFGGEKDMKEKMEELRKMKKDAMMMKRKAQLEDAGLDAEEALAAVESFNDVNDEAFEAVVAMMKKKGHAETEKVGRELAHCARH